MFIVITGLDGSGTSTIANELNKIDKSSILLKNPNPIYTDRKKIDDIVSKDSPVANMLYYLSSNFYTSDFIKNNINCKDVNVYCVRYLIDTVVSNRVAGINIDLTYEYFGHKLLEPDLTIFVSAKEDVRSKRISNRGKDSLDYRLDDSDTREKFLNEFNRLLDINKTLYIDNSAENLDSCIKYINNKIVQFKENQNGLFTR